MDLIERFTFLRSIHSSGANVRVRFESTNQNTSIVSCPFHGVSCPFHGFLPAGLLLRILVASVLSSVVLVVRTVLFSTQSVYLWGI